MTPLDVTLDEFGQSLHLDRLALSPKGAAALKIDQVGQLHFERQPGSLLILLVRELGFVDANVLKRALMLCDPSEPHPFQPIVALKGERELVCGVLLPDDEVTVPALEQTLEALDRFHQQITNS